MGRAVRAGGSGAGGNGTHPLPARAAARVLFDADCGFCTRSANWLATWSAASVEPLQAVDLAALGIDATRAESELPAVLVSGDVVYGSDAIAAALASGPWWARLAAGVLRLPVLRRVAQASYRWVARHRYQLPGGTAACRLP